MHPNQVTEWRRQMLERAAEVFGGMATAAQPAVDLKALHAKLGQLALGERFFRRRAHQSGFAERKRMIDRKHELPIKRQAQLLSIICSSVYYYPSQSALPIWR